MAELRSAITRIRECPSAFVRTCGEVLALLQGFDMAKDYSPLDGLKQWLVVRLDYGNNLAWDALALLVLDVKFDKFAEGKIQEHHDAIVSLINLVEEFLNDREKRGVEAIISDHQTWLKSQDWYREEIDG